MTNGYGFILPRIGTGELVVVIALHALAALLLLTTPPAPEIAAGRSALLSARIIMATPVKAAVDAPTKPLPPPAPISSPKTPHESPESLRAKPKNQPVLSTRARDERAYLTPKPRPHQVQRKPSLPTRLTPIQPLVKAEALPQRLPPADSVAAAPPMASAAAAAVNNIDPAPTRASGPALDSNAYFAELLARLNRFKRYPAELRKEKIEGRVVMKFTIEADGRVIAASVQTSSGNRALDAAARQMVASASPLPAIPDALRKSRLTLSVPVEYSLITER